MTPFRRSSIPALLAIALCIPQRGSAQSTDSTQWRRRLQPFPAIASAPETGLQLGLTMLAVFEPPAARHARPASIVPTIIRSAKGQTRASVEGEYWSRENARRLWGSLAWQRFPLPYYGVGDQTPETAKETYTPEGIDAQATIQQRVHGQWYGLVSARLIDQTITADTTTGVLRTKTITGATGGRVSEVGVGLLRDSRDFVFNPHRGTLAQLTVTASRSAIGSDFSYVRRRLDVRQYVPVGASTLALNYLGLWIDGDAIPFDQLNLVGGGDMLRGYTRGRYRDVNLQAAQAEWRTPIRRRVGAVAFGGLGILNDHNSATSTKALPTYGAGLRFQIDPRQRTAVRVDYGRGRDGASGLYIGFNQAF
ncbi:MAG: outer membrane protein assembly factor [Gemmatimonadaceae bacterium]|nr:outer membrane protein assembly factor [Gemmatimonadaceae bacterium]